MAIQMKDIPQYEPNPASAGLPEIEMDVGGSRFTGDPSNLMSFMGKMQDLWSSSEARKNEEAQANDITQVDPEKFRKTLQSKIGGDYRKVNLYDETTKLYQSRLSGLRSHVFGGRIPQKPTAEEQRFFANQAAKLWQVCAVEAKAGRDTMMQEEIAGMDELNKRLAGAREKDKVVAQQRKQGVDLRKLYTGESIKQYQTTGDVSVLKKEKEAQKGMTPYQSAQLYLQVEKDMDDWVPPFKKDEEGNFVMNGKTVTPQQVAQARQAEIERRLGAAKGTGPRMADVSGGPKKGTETKWDIRNIFPESKERGKEKRERVYEQKTEDGRSIWVNDAGEIFTKDPGGKSKEKKINTKPSTGKKLVALIKRARTEVPDFGEDVIRNMVANGEVDKAIDTLWKLLSRVPAGERKRFEEKKKNAPGYMRGTSLSGITRRKET